MKQSVLLTLTATLAGTALAIGGSAQPAAAVNLSYGFTVNIFAGNPYAGTYRGAFTYDYDLANKPLQPCGGANFCATPATHGLTVRFPFLGKTYTEQDDLDFLRTNGLFPQVVYDTPTPTVANGGLRRLALGFAVIPPTANPTGFFIFGEQFRTGENTDILFAEDGRVQVVGNVAYSAPMFPPAPPPPPPCGDNCAAVPEPSEIAGTVVAVGLLGGVWRLRRRRQRLKL
jgi:hypothetical protein